MKKISKVVLHNFKSHKHTEVDFSDFTAIIGPTNSGKSAMIAGIKLALYNEPSGTKFISHGETECYVEVIFDDMSKIKRVRSEKLNQYILTDAEGKEIELNNFGSGSVDMVMEFHGMPKVNLFGDSESLNLCHQFATPFFLNESPRKRATMIGKLARTDIADLAFQNASSDLRKAKQQEKTYKSELTGVKANLKELKDLPKAELAVEKIKFQFKGLMTQYADIVKLEKLKTDLENALATRDKLLELISLDSDVESVLKQIEDLTQAFNKVNRVIRINQSLTSQLEVQNKINKILDSINLQDVEAAQVKISELEKTMDSIAKIERLNTRLTKEVAHKKQLENIALSELDFDSINNSLEECKSIISKLNKINGVVEKIGHEQSRHDKGTAIIGSLERDFKNKLSEYKVALESEKKCPLCLSDISHEHLDDIEKFI